jgi:hypothetical protein
MILKENVCAQSIEALSHHFPKEVSQAAET